MNAGNTIDPLTLSIIERRLECFNIEVGERVFRQAFSFATAHLRDLGVALLDKQERIMTVGNFLPAASSGADIAIKGMLDYIGRDNIRPNDFIIGNDPFIVRWGHMADWCFVRPIFYKGELLFYHVLKTHQYDTGGAFMAAYYPGLFDCHGESTMIPPVKLIEEGRIDEKVYSQILRNVRNRAVVRADNLLVYESMKKVEERVLNLLDTYGKDTVLTTCDELIKRTEALVRETISTWPAGTFRAERAADWDGTTDEPVWLRLNLTIIPQEGHLILDWSDSDPARDYINLPLGRLWAAVASAVAWTLPPGIPHNQGLANCLTIITKKGTVLDPQYPATTGGAVILANESVECVHLAIAQAVPKETPALWSRSLSPILVGRRRDRIDSGTGAPQAYTEIGYHSDGGGGALYGYDGVDSWGPYFAGGAMKKAPVETEEWESPYRFVRWEFLTDACGHGKWRGGLGIHLEMLNTYDPKLWQPHDCVLQTGNFEGEKFGTLGLMGGTGGAPHKLGIIRKGKAVQLRCLSAAYLEPGDIVWTKSGGGGGVGDPLDRDIEKVRWDVLNEYISNQVARDVYGVLIDPKTLVVDDKATKTLREKLRAKRVDDHHENKKGD